MHRTTWMLFARPAWPLTVMVCAGLTGCLSTGRLELLETRLREQEVEIDRYERELVDMRSQLSVEQRRTRMLHEKLAGTQNPVTPEATEQIAKVEGLKFNTLLTAAQDADKAPGDERIHALVYPHDSDGQLVKLIGKVVFEAMDLSQPEGSRTVGRWELDADQALETWHAGFLSSGYKFSFPWQNRPTGKEILLHVKLESPDGREFTASHTVKIEPPVLLATAPEAPVLDSPPDSVTASSADGADDASHAESVQPVAVEPSADDASSAPGLVLIDSIEETEKAVPPSSTGPLPFPSATQTSDNWTSESIPVLR